MLSVCYFDPKLSFSPVFPPAPEGSINPSPVGEELWGISVQPPVKRVQSCSESEHKHTDSTGAAEKNVTENISFNSLSACHLFVFVGGHS